ncbi:MAG: hypothetical protein KAT65_08340, partial [Methanophagales archaeon]|nr:hypothetical protein [Methanophagales archaeon]
VNEHHEVRASIVPDTFWRDAPLDWVDVEEDGVHFEFNKSQIQKDIPYNFSVVIKVELTGNEAPPILYKPEFYVGQGIYYNESTLAGERYTAEIPDGMLPDNVNYASVTTNVSNRWTLKRHNNIIAVLGEIVERVGPHAEFEFNRDFNIWTKNDTISNGTYESDKWYGMHIENVEDTSGTVLSDFVFSAKADNITGVDWEEYAEWNKSSVEWNFPAYPEFTMEEDEGFGTGFNGDSEIKDVNVSVSRWMNITEFNSSGYQLAKFNVTFKDTNFEWVWAYIEANEHHEIDASIVPGTFTYDAPLDDFDVWEHGVNFDFDKERIETGVTYNFSILIKVELTGKEAPPIRYKPQFSIGEGLYYNSTTGEGYKIEIPAEMLPDNVSYASASTDVSNAWLIKRHNHLIAGLEEVSELAKPHARFHLDKNFIVRTVNDSIESRTYDLNMIYSLSIKNVEDTSHTVLGDLEFSADVDMDNVAIIGVKWGEYAEWNESHVKWSFPPDFVIHEDDWFGTGFKTNYSESREVNVSVNRWMNKTE